jgi:hypothetical protein
METIINILWGHHPNIKLAGIYLVFGAWDLVLDGLFLEPMYLSFSL